MLAAPAPCLPSPALLCIGRFCAEKGHLLLLEAFAQLDRPGLRLVLAGDGEFRPLIEAKIAELGLGERVTITGWIGGDEVRRRIDEATLLVQPSLMEGLPVVIMEAMALGRPVISTFVAGIPELVQDGRTGWLVPVGDVGSLARAMAEALDTPVKRLEEMGRAGAARARERHHIDTEPESWPRCSGPRSGAAPAMKAALRRAARDALAAWPARAALRAFALRGGPVTVLCYHTLGPDEGGPDAWTVLRTGDFRAHLAILREAYDIVDLDTALAAGPGQAGRPRAVLTFDDGETGLHRHLLPLLETERVPATVYIATRQIETGQPYWFDRLMGALQGPRTVDLRQERLGVWTLPAAPGASRWLVLGSRRTCSKP